LEAAMILEALAKLEEEALKKRGSLIKAFETISSRYRKQEGLFLRTDEERLAYLFTRLPGTYGAITKVFDEITARNPEEEFNSFLDVGAGPGSGMWGAYHSLRGVKKCTLLEQDMKFMQLGKRLASFASPKNALWRSCNLEGAFDVEPHDLTLLSYSIGELKEESWKPLLTTLFQATKKVLVVIEPGTPEGYKKIMKIRDLLLELGGVLQAPCPHSKKCPLPPSDWCHFSVRVQRSSLHRQLKLGALGYEDEKFCYLVFGKKELPPFAGRVIRHPMKHTGFVELTLCKKEGVEKKVYSKKDKQQYKLMKKVEWGEFLNKT
jgi:ribosomal protein RSM22 (predicted rRNA methylase)